MATHQNSGRIFGPFSVMMEPPDQTQPHARTTIGSTDLSCDFKCPGVPTESEIDFRVKYRASMHPAFPAGTFVESSGRLIVLYDDNGNPNPIIAATLLRPHPGDVEAADYEDDNIARN